MCCVKFDAALQLFAGHVREVPEDRESRARSAFGSLIGDLLRKGLEGSAFLLAKAQEGSTKGCNALVVIWVDICAGHTSGAWRHAVSPGYCCCFLRFRNYLR